MDLLIKILTICLVSIYQKPRLMTALFIYFLNIFYSGFIPDHHILRYRQLVTRSRMKTASSRSF